MEDGDIELSNYRSQRKPTAVHEGGLDANGLLSGNQPTHHERSQTAKTAQIATNNPRLTSNGPPAVNFNREETSPPSTAARVGRWYQTIKFVHIIDATSGDARDHFALERTWLAYDRTANTLASSAVVVAQLFVLHKNHRTVGRVAGAVIICGGIVIQMVGALRYLQQSRALAHKSESTGKGRAALPTLSLIVCALVVGGVCVGLFVLILVVA